MKIYAVMINSNRIMRVFADNEEAARKAAEEKLTRPGRYVILKGWREAGEVVKEM